MTNNGNLKDGKRAPLSLISKMIIYFLSVAAVYYATEFLVNLAHKVVFNPDEYLSFRNQSQHVKYFVVGAILSLTGFKFLIMNNKWRLIFSAFLVASIFGIAWFGTAFQAANEEGVVKNRLTFTERYGWDEVAHIETDIYQKSRSTSKQRKRSRSTYRKGIRIEIYNAYVNGDKIELWDDLDSMYEVSKVLSDKQIRFKHNEDPSQFDMRFTSFYGDKLDKAHFVFGISNDKEVE